MREIVYTKSFLKDTRRLAKQNKDKTKLQAVMELLIQRGGVTSGYRPHKLKGEYRGCWECHIEYDWLLIYRRADSQTIELLRTGSHADLFNN
jgi:mRNA interferase YafQ